MSETNVSQSYQVNSLEEQQAAYDRWANLWGEDQLLEGLF